MNDASNILAAIDVTDAGAHVLHRAMALANERPGAVLHVLTVVEPVVPGALTVPTAKELALERLKELVDWLLRADRERGITSETRIELHVLSGPAADEVVWLAAHVDADLVVVGTHGRRGVARLLLGSVAEKVARRAGCPVLVERGKQHDASWRVPPIEPPCTACLAERDRTDGRELWCERHRGHRPHTHVYGYRERSSSTSSAPGFTGG